MEVCSIIYFNYRSSGHRRADCGGLGFVVNHVLVGAQRHLAGVNRAIVFPSDGWALHVIGYPVLYFGQHIHVDGRCRKTDYSFFDCDCWTFSAVVWR